jgi:PAS domain S-box-containing protein
MTTPADDARPMRRLRFTKKFAVLGCVVLITVLLLLYSLIATLNERINTTHREQSGARATLATTKLIQAVQQHRGLSSMLIVGEPLLEKKLAAKQAEVNALLKNARNELPSNNRNREYWHKITDDWSDIQETGLEWTGVQNFNAHTGLISDMLEIQLSVADDSGLTIDPDAGSHYLMETGIIKMPLLLERLGRLRGKGTTALIQRKIPPQTRIDFNILDVEINVLLHETASDIKRITRHAPALETTLGAAFKTMHRISDEVLQIVASDILHEQFTMPPAEYFTLTTVAIDAGYQQLYDNIYPSLDKLLESRIEKALSDRRLSVVACLVIFSALFYLLTADALARKRAEDALLTLNATLEHERQEAELRYKNFSELAGDWYWEQDENFCFTYFSQGFVESTGVSRPLTLGTTRWDGFGSRDSPGIDWAGHIRTNEAHLPFRDFEYPSHHGNRPLWIRASGRPRFDEKGRFLGYVGVASEISAYKKAEEAAILAGIEREENRTRLAQIVDGSPVPTFVLDREHRVTYWNHACEALTGVSAASLIGTNEQWRAFYSSERAVMADLIIDGESGGEVSALYSDTWRRSDIIEGAYEAESFFPNFGAEGRWLFFTAAPLRDANGEVIGAIETLQDVTERRIAEAALKQKAEEEALQTSSYFQEVLDNLPFGVFVLDKSLDAVYWNSHVEHLFSLPDSFMHKGLSIKTVIRHLAEVGCYGPGDLEELVENRFARLSMFQAHSVELTRPGGGTLLVRGSPVMIGDRPSGFILLQEDITERKQDEQLARQREMEKSLAVLRDAVSNINQGISMFDADLNLAVCNQLFMELHDFPESLARIGTPFSAFARNNAERGEYGPGNIEEQVQARVLQASQLKPHQFERERPDGRVIEIVGKPLPDGGFISTYTDITERKRGEREMERLLKVLHNTISNLTQGVSLMDADLNVKVCNQRFLELLDLPESLGVSGAPLEAIFRYNAERGEYGPGDVEKMVRARVALARRFEAHLFERERPDGRIIEINGKPLPDGGFITTYTDITERKRSEIALQEFNTTLEQKITERTETLHQTLAYLGAAQDRLAQIVDGSPVAAYVLDHERHVTHWNRACENLTGVSAASILGTRETWRYFYENERPMMADLIVSGELAGELDKLYADNWRRSEIIDGAFEAESFFPNFGESGRWLFFTAAPLRDEAGQVVGAIETLRDITEQRTAESALNDRAQALQQALKDLGNVIENLEQTQDELVRSEKMAALGSMVAGVAHELNTPIGNSLMVASHLVETSKKMKESLRTGLKKSMLDEFLADTDTAGDVLVRNLGKAANLVSSFKQVAVDQTSSQRRSFKLAEMIGEVITSLGPTIKATPYVVEQDVAADILMESFPGPLGQVITNLINNGIIHGFDSGPSGLIRIAAEKSQDSEQVVLKITDNGKGIPSDVLPRIFDPFFTTRLGQGGSGLGLNIVHNIVFSILGGRIIAESTPGAGSCFTLTLPLTAPEQGNAQDAPPNNATTPAVQEISATYHSGEGI